MKKKFLMLLLAICLFVPSAFLLSACGGGVNCVHDYAMLTRDEYLKTAGTCLSPAVYYKACHKCGAKSDETYEASYGEHVKGDYFDEVPATCTEDGVMAHWDCTVCGFGFTVPYVYEKIDYETGLPIAEDLTIKAHHTIDDGTCTTCNEFFYSKGLDAVDFVGHGNSETDYKDLYSISNNNFDGEVLVIPSDYYWGSGVDDYHRIVAIGSFRNCKRLKTVYIPASVTNIYSGAFVGCTRLENIYYYGDVNDFVQFDFTSLSYSQADNINIYFNDMKVTDIDITTATKIGDKCFYKCNSLKSVNIGSSVKSIGARAFAGCENLTSVTFADDLEADFSGRYNYGYIFEGCSSLKSVTLPRGMTVSEGLFKDCTSLQTVNLLNENITTIPDKMFQHCTSLTTVTGTQNLTEIGSYAFSGCENLVNMTIPDSITTVCYYAFADCKKLKMLSTPASLKNIYEYAFKNCLGLITANIAEGIYTIADGAFYGCENLVSISLPSTLRYNYSHSSDYMFVNTYRLVEIINKSSEIEIAAGDNFTTNLGNIAKYAEVVTDGDSNIDIVDDYVFFTKYGTTAGNQWHMNYLVDYIGSDTEITLPDSYNDEAYYIAEYAFYNKTDLKRVIIMSEKIEKISAHAFENCKALQSITLTTNNISSTAFANCNLLHEIILGNEYLINYNKDNFNWFIYSDEYGHQRSNLFHSEENSQIVVDGDFEFILDKNNALYLIGYTGNDSEVTLPIKPKDYTIDAYAFYNNKNITKVTIPSCVDGIRGSAFENCTNLREVVFDESDGKSQLEGIRSRAFANCTSLRSITLPSNRIYFDDDNGGAFLNCYNLLSFSYYHVDGYWLSYEDDFEGCYNLVEIINRGAEDLREDTHFPSDRFVHCDENSVITKTSDGYYFITKESVNYLIGYDGTETRLVLPANYNGGNYVIKDYAFYLNDKIKSVVIPEGVTAIGAYAFYKCANLGFVSISDSVKSIGERAFYMDYSIFVLGKGVETIGDFAFYLYTSRSKVYYTGTKEEFENISLGDYTHLNDTYQHDIYYYSETKVDGGALYWHYDEYGDIVIW